MKEEWKNYKTYDRWGNVRTNIEVSNFGNVRGAEVNIYNERRCAGTLQIFKLVWKLFVGQVSKGYVVHHIDHNKLNDRLDNLMLMSKAEHISHHWKDYHPTEDTKRKISEANKGKQTWKGKHHTDETKKKLSKSLKGNKNSEGRHLSEESKRKISESNKGNQYNKGRKWFNNGITNCFTFNCPEGFVSGRLK